MKFITEAELRDTYRIHPFTTYEVEPGTRLTPGARQFLSDRGIHSYDSVVNNTAVKGFFHESKDELKTTSSEVVHNEVVREEASVEEVRKTVKPPVITIQGEEPIQIGGFGKEEPEPEVDPMPEIDPVPETDPEPEAEAESEAVSEPAGDDEIKDPAIDMFTASAAKVFEPCDDKMLLLRFKAVKAEFLLAGQELLSLNVMLDQSLMTLCEQISGISKALKNGTAFPQDLDPERAGVSTISELSAEKPDPFEVTSFHMQLPNGKEILLLNKLRCNVQLLAEEVNEKATEDRKEYMVVSARLNQIINTLSYLMSEEVGGK